MRHKIITLIICNKYIYIYIYIPCCPNPDSERNTTLDIILNKWSSFTCTSKIFMLSTHKAEYRRGLMDF